MSTTTPGVKNATTVDAPTLEPTLTTIVTENSANGAEGHLLEYEQYATAITCATDTVHRIVEESR